MFGSSFSECPIKQELAANPHLAAIEIRAISSDVHSGSMQPHRAALACTPTGLNSVANIGVAARSAGDQAHDLHHQCD